MFENFGIQSAVQRHDEGIYAGGFGAIHTGIFSGAKKRADGLGINIANDVLGFEDHF